MYTFDETMFIVCMIITVTIFLILIERIIRNIKRVKALNNIISEFDEYIEEHAIVVLDENFRNNQIVANIRTIQ